MLASVKLNEKKKAIEDLKKKLSISYFTALLIFDAFQPSPSMANVAKLTG